jgi:hypothetical protein
MLFMWRVSFLTLLVASFLAGFLQAQQAVATFQGHAAGLPPRSSHLEQSSALNGLCLRRGVSNQVFLSGLHRAGDGMYGFLLPYVPDDQSSSYEQSDTVRAPNEAALPTVINQHEDLPAATREKPLPKSQVIDIPSNTDSRAPKSVSPTIFILVSGERLESSRFLLSARNLSITIDGQHRAIPLEMLDLDATMAANRQRGIDLRIPADQNEVVLSF